MITAATTTDSTSHYSLFTGTCRVTKEFRCKTWIDISHHRSKTHCRNHRSHWSFRRNSEILWSWWASFNLIIIQFSHNNVSSTVVCCVRRRTGDNTSSSSDYNCYVLLQHHGDNAPVFVSADVWQFEQCRKSLLVPVAYIQCLFWSQQLACIDLEEIIRVCRPGRSYPDTKMLCSYSNFKTPNYIGLWFSKAPIVFLAISAFSFMVGLNLFPYSSHQVRICLLRNTSTLIRTYGQLRFVAIITNVFTALHVLGLMIVSSWFLVKSLWSSLWLQSVRRNLLW